MLFKSLLFASTASASCLHGLYGRAEGGEVEIPNFGYENTFGPLNWASLAVENEACKTGQNQSPINIDSTISYMSEKPIINIPQQPVEFENLNTTIEVIVNGTTTIGNDQFQLAQFHIHTPSEHRINREYFPLEVHMVHKGIANPSQVAVLALMFDVCTSNRSDPIIGGITPHLSAIQTPGTKTTIPNGLDFSGVISAVQTSSIFQYTGSLTTPPCSEGVLFLAVENPLRISVADYNAIKKTVKFNSRVGQNTLGNENIIMVGAASGMSEGGSEGGSANATVQQNRVSATGAEEQPAEGSKVIAVTEISGLPVATPIQGLVMEK